MVLLDHVSHVQEFVGRDSNRCHAIVHLIDGKKLYVTESVEEVAKRIRKVAEDDQRERMRAWIKEEVEKLLPEMAEKTWRYDENSR